MDMNALEWAGMAVNQMVWSYQSFDCVLYFMLIMTFLPQILEVKETFSQSPEVTTEVLDERIRPTRPTLPL